MNLAARNIDGETNSKVHASVNPNTAQTKNSGSEDLMISQVGILRPDSIMPWDLGLAEDKRFNRWLIQGAGISILLAILTSQLPERQVPVTVQKENRQLYAQLVIEEKVIPPPVIEEKPLPKPVIEKYKAKVIVDRKHEKPEVVKTREKLLTIKEKPPESKLPTKAELREKAREQAANAGLLALTDQLSSLRDQSVSSVSRLQTGGDQASVIKRNVLAAKTNNNLSSGAKISRQSTTAGLANREKAAVVVSEAAVYATAVESASSTSQQNRSADEIRRVMDSNKGTIYSVYNRALRKNPVLEGTFGFVMTIESSGKISKVEILNSELADPNLEKRLLARIRMITFEAKSVGVTEVNYSFDFLPH